MLSLLRKKKYQKSFREGRDSHESFIHVYWIIVNKVDTKIGDIYWNGKWKTTFLKTLKIYFYKYFALIFF